jgi:hypothetical protein
VLPHASHFQTQGVHFTKPCLPGKSCWCTEFGKKIAIQHLPQQNLSQSCAFKFTKYVFCLPKCHSKKNLTSCFCKNVWQNAGEIERRSVTKKLFKNGLITLRGCP